MATDAPLRIAYLTYRGKPHVGGQGVYTRHLTKALVDLGHTSRSSAASRTRSSTSGSRWSSCPSLDIYNDHFPMRQPGIWELKNWKDMLEVTAFTAGTFPEPLAFSMRAWDHLRHRKDEFDIVQDNQCLGYGLLLIERQLGLPVLGTIHHPITMDRRLEIAAAEGWYKKLTLRRWYAFVDMQTQVARRLERIITVSENSFKDIVADHKVDPDRMAVVPVGVDPELFRPLPDVKPVPGRLITTASADVAMKGLKFLLEAVAKLRTERDDVHLVVIGRRKPGGRQRQDHQEARPRGRTSSSSPACPRSASSSSTPRPSWPSCRRSTRASRSPPSRPCRCGVPARGHHRRRHPRGRRHRRRDRPARAPGRQRGAGRQAALGPRPGRPPQHRRRPRPRSASSTAGPGGTPP